MDANNTKPELLANLKDSIVWKRHQKTDEVVPTTVNCDIAARLVSEQNRYAYTIENGQRNGFPTLAELLFRQIHS